MKSSIYTTIIALFLFFFHGHAQPAYEKRYPSDLLIKDLAFIKTSVEGLHPGYNRFGKKGEFDAACDSVRTILQKDDSLSLKAFFRLVNPMLVKIRCGHTKFFAPMKGFPFYFYTDHLLPVIVRFDDGGRLLVIKSINERFRGKFLEKINGKPVTEIVTELRKQMFTDGFVRSSADAQIEQYFSAWYADFVQEAEKFQLTFKDESGQETLSEADGISTETWQELNKNTSSLISRNRLEMKNDSVALLRIPGFYSNNGNKHFISFLDSSFTEIRKKNIQHLIVDVRDNEGGNDVLGKELFARMALKDFNYYDRIEVKAKTKKQVPNHEAAYFPKFIGLARFFIHKDAQGRLLFKKHKNLGAHHPRKDAYRGKVWFLTNGLSYSVTSEFLAVARSENRGIFVGAESGGTYEGDNSGTFVIFKLPATSLDLGVPVGGYYMAVKPGQEPGRGIIPDIKVLPTRQDLLENRDPAIPLVMGKIAGATYSISQ
ncbi:S41 family peptidase [Dyadobacter pollutisoli]|uniref:S41 family peptidase n=1 Tax=Dyadobacter pollutisoli TaxID=2910158 RepID=A0A9E8NHX5_9BACT|nr:S41 family peptidase [Dyadobacter pollutisoli]WAC15291.1 S41 family peptidase [Dyadobacter pollutisoli]